MIIYCKSRPLLMLYIGFIAALELIVLHIG